LFLLFNIQNKKIKGGEKKWQQKRKNQLKKEKRKKDSLI
jgi:hypothetical protein